MTIQKSNSRIEWMDVLRGLLILSVVIGHATGLFNRYIYQFHMGAFFFVSGYMARPERRTVPHTIYHRFMTTYLPIFSITILLALVYSALAHMGLYRVFMGESVFFGFRFIIEEFVLHGNQYVWWLGAAWFALVLFYASVLNRVTLYICGERYSFTYLLLGSLLFWVGYIHAETDGSNPLIFIAQFYFLLGTYVKNKKIIKDSYPVSIHWIGLSVTTLILYLFSRFNLTVDYPSLQFNHPVVDVAMALNGAAFCFFAANLLSKISVLKSMLQSLGKNTLPIMLFHFMLFNLGYWILYIFNVVPFEYLQNFTPTYEIGRIYWPLFTVIAVSGSILLWKLMMMLLPPEYFWDRKKISMIKSGPVFLLCL